MRACDVVKKICNYFSLERNSILVDLWDLCYIFSRNSTVPVVSSSLIFRVEYQIIEFVRLVIFDEFDSGREKEAPVCLASSLIV